MLLGAKYSAKLKYGYLLAKQVCELGNCPGVGGVGEVLSEEKC